MIKKRKAFICGIKGKKLSQKEILFLKKYKPWGIILFSRNIHSIKQTQRLTNQIKILFKDRKYPILVDEEGGRVSRLRNFIDNSKFSAEYFGELFKKDKKKFNLYFNIYIKQFSYLLNLLGININTVPNLDLRRKFSHKVVGDRSYSSDPKEISKIGDICINGFHKSGICTVIKHIPGHGLAKVDSHNKLPVVNHSFNYLMKNDFLTFKKKKSLFAMTGHVLFNDIDEYNCATHSKKVIQIIRNKINFNNIIISDDLSMKSLKHSISINTKKAFTAGCNLVLHCNGNLNEMVKVATNSPYINKFIIKKTSEFKDII
tara:strand:- start:7653 stop:8600 length:948 start_codon:yes stop_codon:yes gene_type:complete